MTQEDKELLLVDLSARSPYGVIVIDKYGFVVVLTWKEIKDFEDGYISKPYLHLRQMSSMTKEEKVQLSQYACIGEDLNGEFIDEVQRKDCATYIDWLNAHHLDYRDLIQMGLAIEAPEVIYNLKVR